MSSNKKSKLKLVESLTPSLMDTLNDIIKKYTLSCVAKDLNVSNGTVSRWIELDNIPRNYEFDIFKIANIHVDYSKYTTKEKDQFFTPVETARKCFDIFKTIVSQFGEKSDDFVYIEPSAGDGSFLNVLPADTIAMDVEPNGPNIIKQDYLDWKPSTNGKYVVFGNPPFGLRGHMALKFINHSHDFADYVCFILPQLFESDGKGVPRKRVKGYNLIHSVKIDPTFYEPNKNVMKINTVFQIWSKNHVNDMYEIKDFKNENMVVYSLSDGGTVSTTRNKKMIGNCDAYLPSTCFGKENMRLYADFEELPGRKGYGIVFNNNKDVCIEKMNETDWSSVAFLSTNSAYNLRSSQIYSLFTD